MKVTWGKVKGTVLRYFPERQLFLRSNNRVRYLTIPTPVQLVGATGLCVSFIWICVATLQVILQSSSLEAQEMEIKSISADYLSLSNDFTSLEKELERRARLIEKRQNLIDGLITELADDQNSEILVSLSPDSAPSKTPENAEVSQSAPANAAEDQAVANGKNENENENEDDYNPDTFENGAAGKEPNTGFTHVSAVAIDRVTPSAVASLPSTTRRQNLLARMEALVSIQNNQAEQLASLLTKRTSMVSGAMAKTSVGLQDVFASAQGPVGGPFMADEKVPAVFAQGDDQPLVTLQAEYDTYKVAMTVLANIPVGAPSDKYYISDYFGPRRDPIKGVMSNHPGIDIAAWKGTPVLAPSGGKVVFSGWRTAYGNVVDIDHGNGFKTRYGHMSKLRVKKGDMVSVRQQIGDVGDTGRTTGAHIHYEIWFNGRLQNPLPFMKVESDVREIQTRFHYGAASHGK